MTKVQHSARHRAGTGTDYPRQAAPVGRGMAQVATKHFPPLTCLFGGSRYKVRVELTSSIVPRGSCSPHEEETVARRPKGQLSTWPGPQDRKIEGRKLWASPNVSNDAADFSLTASLAFPAAPARRNRLDCGVRFHTGALSGGRISLKCIKSIRNLTCHRALGARSPPHLAWRTLRER